MSFTYNAAGFNSTSVGVYTGSTEGVRWQIRMLTHDTNESRPFMQDEEIDWIQTQENNAYMMSARVLDTLIAKVGAIKSKKISEFGIIYDIGQLRALSAEYRARGLTYQMPYAGGISVSDKVAVQGDADATKPSFARGLEDNPGAPVTTAAPDSLTVQQ